MIPLAVPPVVVSGAILNLTEVIDCAVEFEALAVTLAYTVVEVKMDKRAIKSTPGKKFPRVLFICDRLPS